MEHDPQAWLFDILSACEDVVSFTHGLTFDEYCKKSIVRAAVERKFMIIGEALTRIRKEAPNLEAHISDMNKVIGFRHVLAHGYSVVDDATVWSAVCNNLPILRREIEMLIRKK